MSGTSKNELALKGGKPVVPAGEHVRWPVLSAEDKAAVMGVLERGVLSGPFAPEVRALEREFADYIGTKHALATNSGTAALHVAIAAAGIGPGDEIITSAFSFVATALAVLHHNAIPVFVDIEPKAWGLDPAKLEAAITPRTKAILPVHIHGVPCDLAPMQAIAKKHNLILIEDAAQSHGAAIGKKRVGSLGAMGCFSLQSSKSLACGEGGILTTDDDELFQRANRTRMFGEDIRQEDAASWRIERALDGNRAYDSMTMGWMYRTNEMSAALTRSQLRRLEQFNESARRNADILRRRLSSLPGLELQHVADGNVPVWHKLRVRLDATKAGVEAEPRRVRDAVIAALKAEGVDAVMWQSKPVPGQTLFREKLGFGRLPGAPSTAPGVPWSLGAPVDYSLAQFPETTRLLDSSLCLFSHTYPIAPQPPSLAEAYADAFAKVWSRLDEVVATAQAK